MWALPMSQLYCGRYRLVILGYSYPFQDSLHRLVLSQEERKPWPN